MKRNERTNYNHIARDIRKNGIESIINIEVPTNYTHEARQAFHELLTAYNLRAVCIYWNDIEKTWALHYEPARYPEAHDEKRRQETEDVDTVTARMTRRNWTWNGYPAPATETEAETAQNAPQEATAADPAQQPTETENAPQAATQTAEGTDEEKEAETMTTTEREALERINARQNAANLFTNIGPADIADELAAMEAERTTPAPDPDAATLAPADAAQVWDEDGNTPFESAEAAMHAATVAGIIRRKGGYRERDILNHPHTIERGTWTTEHKVIEILAATPDPDGYRPGCAVDIVTRSIVG